MTATTTINSIKVKPLQRILFMMSIGREARCVESNSRSLKPASEASGQDEMETHQIARDLPWDNRLF
jgi:hypothetical protein